jgi:multiple antibiotic resistance protein
MEYFSYFLITFTSLFTIVNPFSAMPFYSSLVEELPAPDARALAFRTSFAALMAMIFFALSGEFIFSFFNVSIDGLRVVGGVMFSIMGYDMLQGKESRTKVLSASERVDMQDIRVKAITPLAVPLICGPGTITVLNVMVHDAPSLIHRGMILLATVIVCLMCFLILTGSNRIMGVIGISGQKVFFRIMGLILMMIAVEYFFAGIRPYIQSLMLLPH